MSAFENLPPIHIPKKRRAEELPGLHDERERLETDLKHARKRLKAHGSFNGEFWAAATDVESIILKRTRIISEISLSEFAGEPAEWQKTEKARHIFEQLRAQGNRMSSFTAQRDSLSLTKPKRSLRESFMKLFTTSGLGLNIKTGAGQRDSNVQSNFRSRLLQDYNSLDNKGNAWCPILGAYIDSDWVTASHLFAYKHGQETMDAIFGQIRPTELFSSRNGLILSAAIEKHFDAGVLVIVPDLPEKPTTGMLSHWTNQEVREYKTRIIDSEWEKLDANLPGGLRWRDLDNRKLHFRGETRPAARYLYFHYCLQVLRRAWKAGPGQKDVFSLKDELGKPFWETPGKYVCKNMLQAFVEELGHEYQDLMIGASPKKGERKALFHVAVNQIAECDVNSEEEQEKGNEAEDEEF